jgi:hypothetical protein
MNEKQMVHNLVDAYIRSGTVEDGTLKLVRVQDRKTTYVEPNGSGGQSIMMDEYRVDGQVLRVGYSSRSQTVYVSLV